jgi:hypothetical protein
LTGLISSLWQPTHNCEVSCPQHRYAAQPLVSFPHMNSELADTNKGLDREQQETTQGAIND